MRRIFTIAAALALSAHVCAQADSVAIEALSRLKGMDLEANPALKGAVLKTLERTKGTPQFVEIVRDFDLKGQTRELVEFAAKNPNDAAGVEALRIAIKEGGIEALQPISLGLIQAMGNTSDKHLIPVLARVVEDGTQPLENRKAAVKGLARTEEGAACILRLATDGKLDSPLQFTAATSLNSARWPDVKAEAAKLLPLPQANNAPLLPVAELVKMKGDAANGAKVFRRPEVNCIGCHKVNGDGVDFGPGLSEIGTKLAKEALFEAILDPSSGIAFGYEGWRLELSDGDEVAGLITSESNDEVALKAQTGIQTRYQKAEIVKRTKSNLSLMPAGLQQAMSQQDLVDLVEYLTTLKKK